MKRQLNVTASLKQVLHEQLIHLLSCSSVVLYLPCLDGLQGLINAFGVLSAWIGAMVSANQYVESILRQRIIGKADLLTEFYEWVKKLPPQISEMPEHITPIKEIEK